MKRATRIKGLSEKRRQPRLGKIHLGVKKKTDKGKEYPSAVDFFVCPDEVREVYGEKPRDLDVILPTDNPEEFFPQSYKCYKGSVGLWCSGDGETGVRVGDGTHGVLMEEVECPCELLDSKDCRQVGNLMVILPKVSLGGVYQIDTSSFNSIVNINSGIDFIKDRVGHLVNVPCTLSVRPQEVSPEGKKKKVFVMTLALANFNQIKALTKDMNEIRALLAGRPALPEPSVETDLITAEKIDEMKKAGIVDIDPTEEAPEVEDDFDPRKKPLSKEELDEMWEETPMKRPPSTTKKQSEPDQKKLNLVDTF